MMQSEFSRLHSPEAEQSVIGALLIDSAAADRIGALRPDHFFDSRHQALMTELMAMIAHGKPVDAVTLAEEMHDMGLAEETGGLAYLGEIVANTPGARNVGRYAETVIAKAMERQLLAAADVIRSAVVGVGSTREKLMAAQSAVMAISESVAPTSPQSIREVLAPFVDTLERRAAGVCGGVKTGFVDLDARLNGGMKPGELILIAGRPAMGKTSLAMQVSYHVAQHGGTALVLSMEMSKEQLADRLVSLAGNVALHHVLAGALHGDAGDRIMCGVSQLHALPLVIDDQGGLSLFDVAAKARSVKRKHGLSVLVVDYLQLMVGDGDNRNQQIEQISRGLKSLAKELQVPVIALSQLSRKCEERTNKRPINSDLRESGALEQDADVIIMVYRDEIYQPESPDKGTAEVIVSKNRQGSTGMTRLAFRGDTTSFADLAYDWQPDQQATEKRGRRGF